MTHEYAPAILLELDPMHHHAPTAEESSTVAPDAPAVQEEINLLDQPIGWEESVYG